MLGAKIMEPSAGDITAILRNWDLDRQSSIEALTPIVYGELRKIAQGYFRRQRQGHTLQPTALINEAYLRLVKQEAAGLQDRGHFYTLAARMMRQILVDAARGRSAEKRGAGLNVPLDPEAPIGGTDSALDFLELHESLRKLHEHDARMAEALELRYFGGLELEEIAESLAVSLATVKRDLTLGKAWLRRNLNGLRKE